MRRVVDAARARGSLMIDPKSDEGAWSPLPERVCAFDEDATTLALDAASALPHAPAAVVGPRIDAETVRVALGLAAAPLTASDPMAVATAMKGPVLAIGAPDAASAVAALVVDGEGESPKQPRDVSPRPRVVTALRALQESRRLPPAESVPDSPMGAYVPWETWTEDLPARLRLVAQRCKGCGRTLYPPRGACPACRGRAAGSSRGADARGASSAFDEAQLPREAVVHAATRIGRGGAPSEFALEQMQTGAYWVAVVEWPDHGVKVTARLSGYEEQGPAVGERVRAVVRRLFEQEGRVRYGVKFARVE